MKPSLSQIIAISEIHADRLQYSLNKLADFFPIDQTSLENLDMDKLSIIELMTSRYSKLQDHLGSKLFASLLESMGEATDPMSFIDKINKLEKLGIIKSADAWRKMRALRNHLAHEYPEHPEIMASFLNQTFDSAKDLLTDYTKLKNYIELKNLE